MQSSTVRSDLMERKKIQKEEAPGIVSGALIEALTHHEKVVWFVPGGSNISIAVSAMEQISDELSEKLVITQTDERFGPVGHKDSNWQQMLDAGMNFKKAQTLPILLEEELSIHDTALIFAERIEPLLRKAYTIGQFGIGEDSHIAGIKPQSQAAEKDGLVADYQADDFQRVTLTFDSIRKMHEAHAFAFGEKKQKALQRLEEENPGLAIQPAQVLKSIEKSFLYSDV